MHFSSYLWLILLSFLTNSELIAQTEIFPELTGETLIEALVDEYKPQELLSLSQAKDTLYLRVEARDDSVHGIYTDYTLYLPPDVDPSQALFMNEAGINMEHSWPQSKGAGDGKQGQTDMHHLFPSRVAVNSARASFPYGDITDIDTDKWYYQDIELTYVPTFQIDNYSESVTGMFEPRESVKGDIARAMFYFYTMYKDDADNADPDFFEGQKATLCAWHYSDPVDDIELLRSQRIAAYQGSKENPFVLDCTLAERTYCQAGDPCGTVVISNSENPNIDIHLIQHECNINLIVNINSQIKITTSIINSSGQVLLNDYKHLPEGESIINFDTCDLPQGIYFINARFKNGSTITMQTLKFVIAGHH